MTPIRRLGWPALALFALVGCGEPAGPAPATTPATTSPAPAAPSTDAPKGESEIKSLPVDPAKKGADASAPKLSDEEIAEIKKLPADEQPIALAQVTCPVSGDNLGAMEKPIKQVVDGQTFFLCCSGCEKAVKSNPAGVLAKLKK